MTTYYITGTRKEEKSTVSEIEGYQVNTIKSSGGTYYSKSNFFSSHYNASNSYETYNSNTGAGAQCEKKTSSNNEDYLQTVGNGTSSDNLLSLPNA